LNEKFADPTFLLIFLIRKFLNIAANFSILTKIDRAEWRCGLFRHV